MYIYYYINWSFQQNGKYCAVYYNAYFHLISFENQTVLKLNAYKKNLSTYIDSKFKYRIKAQHVDGRLENIFFRLVSLDTIDTVWTELKIIRPYY